MNKVNAELYTIYSKETKDHPGKMPVRRWEVTGDLESKIVMTPCELVGLADSLEKARQLLPPNCRCLGRHQGEDPCIVESWMVESRRK